MKILLCSTLVLAKNNPVSQTVRDIYLFLIVHEFDGAGLMKIEKRKSEKKHKNFKMQRFDIYTFLLQSKCMNTQDIKLIPANI